MIGFALVQVDRVRVDWDRSWPLLDAPGRGRPARSRAEYKPPKRRSRFECAPSRCSMRRRGRIREWLRSVTRWGDHDQSNLRISRLTASRISSTSPRSPRRRASTVFDIYYNIEMRNRPASPSQSCRFGRREVRERLFW